MKNNLVEYFSVTIPKMNSDSDVAVVRQWKHSLSYKRWDVFKWFPSAKVIQERIRYIRLLDNK